MAEYLEVMKQFHRMCAGGKCPKAIGCPMYPSCNISQCRRIAFEKPAEFENRVMDWAKAHPEPKYPTWADFFLSIGGINISSPIRADIAEKLGIEPKEG